MNERFDEPGSQPGRDPEVPDDLAGADAQLLAALGAPGSADELRDRDRYLQMFRDEQRAPGAPGGTVVAMRPSRSAARRLGVSGTALAAAIALGGGGMAAAYTGSLPDPIQRTVHQVLGPVGVPAAPAPVTHAKQRAKPTPSPSAEPSPSTSPTREPTAKPSPHRTRRPSGGASLAPDPTDAAGSVGTDLPSATPSATPTPEPTPTDTPLPTSTTDPTAAPTGAATPTSPPAPPATPRAVGIYASTHQVAPGATIAFDATVLGNDRRPSGDVVVLLEARTGGDWYRVESGRTDDDGRLTLTSPTVTQNASFRMRVGSGRLVSDPWKVYLQPELVITPTTSVDASGATTLVVDVTALGVRPGEPVRLLRRGPTGTRVVGRGRLAPAGTITFIVTVPEVRPTYVVEVAANKRHLPVQTEVQYVG